MLKGEKWTLRIPRLDPQLYAPVDGVKVLPRGRITTKSPLAAF
jgi:hypothetical protein